MADLHAASPTACFGERDGSGPYVKGVDLECAWYTNGDSDGTVCES